MKDEMKDSPPTPKGWLLYDGSCGFCSWWVPLWRNTLQVRGYDIAPLQAEWVKRELNETDEGLLMDLRLLINDGARSQGEQSVGRSVAVGRSMAVDRTKADDRSKEIRGANVYRYFMRRIWWAFPFYIVSILPGLNRIFDLGYRTFANNRYRISKSCGLKIR